VGYLSQEGGTPVEGSVMEFIVILVLLGLVVGIFVLPIIALIRTLGLGAIRDRLDALEREVRRLRRAQAVAGERGQEDSKREEAGSEILTVLPAEAEEREPPRQEALPAWLAEMPRWEGINWESWIGRRGLGWLAVVLLLFATGFFLKYAFDNQWIGPLGRISLGVAAGLALCIAGWRYHRPGWWVFSQMLTAGGVVLLYLSTYAAFAYYSLIPQTWAGLFLVLLVVEVTALAILYDAPAIALMAIVGGFLTPLLLHSEQDQYRSLFTYLVVLDAGVVGLALFRRWRAIGLLALLGSQGLFWLWYGEHYHPEKLAPALLFQLGVFALFLALPVVMPLWRRRVADVEGMVQTLLNAVLLATAGYVLLQEDYRPWLATFALLLALVYAGVAWLLLWRCPDDPWNLFVMLSTALAFVALAIPLEAEAGWIAVGWAVEGLALWWFSLRVRSRAVGVLGAVCLGLAALRCVFADTPWLGREPFWPVLNPYALPALVVAGCLLAASGLARVYLKRTVLAERAIQVVVGMLGVLLCWFILSVDGYQYWTSQLSQFGVDRVHLLRLAQVTLSVLWAAYAALLLAVGFRLDSVPLRWTALGLFGVSLGKVVLVDMEGLPGLYRVVAFLVLSVMMGAAAWGYQKLEASLGTRNVEGAKT
jgi:uncharacterized membrane protein